MLLKFSTLFVGLAHLLVVLGCTSTVDAQQTLVEAGTPVAVESTGEDWVVQDGALVGSGIGQVLNSSWIHGGGDSEATIRLSIDALDRTAASLVVAGGHFLLDANRQLATEGGVFGPLSMIDGQQITPGEPFTLRVVRRGTELSIFVDDTQVVNTQLEQGRRLGPIGLRPHRGTLRVYDWQVDGDVDRPADPRYTIPMIDLNEQDDHFVTVAREEGQYLGHPTTVLFADNQTMLAAFPTAHGRGDLRLRRSEDAGLTWVDVDGQGIRLHEVPILYLIELPDGHQRVLMTTCKIGDALLQWTWSDDQGMTWAPMQEQKMEGVPNVIVALASLWRVRGAEDEHGRWRGIFHSGRFDNYTIDLVLKEDDSASRGFACDFENLKRLDYASESGLTRARYAGVCEAGIVRSPDGGRLALLMRPQHKRTNAMITFSDDEGETWSNPTELPGSLTGERHVARYAPDGRLLICFRDYSPLNPGNPSHGDWVAWVGTWDDLVNGQEGQYRIRLKRNYGNSTNSRIGDCGYTGVEVLPDGTFICTTYGHWDVIPGSTHPNHPDGRGQAPYILSARFTLEQIDMMLEDDALRLWN